MARRVGIAIPRRARARWKRLRDAGGCGPGRAEGVTVACASRGMVRATRSARPMTRVRANMVPPHTASPATGDAGVT